MCGICGIYNIEKLGNPEQRLRAMRDSMFHRGPDAAGLHISGKTGFAHRRLSIIDLSDSANQPMAAENDSVLITYNGEIYNYVEVREKLKKSGCAFRTESDTEVLLKGFSYWGLEKMLGELNGMFAFAVWDKREGRLFLVRDRLGVKPLFYYLNDGILFFASTLNAIREAVPCELEINPQAIDHLLSYYCLPQTTTIYKDVKRVLPGHFMVFSGGSLREQSYWNLDFTNGTKREEGEILEDVNAMIADAVKLRLRSDVPVGAFLSGGLDSSMVVAKMASAMAKPPLTFSIGFKEQRYNELHYARAIARQYGTQHEEIVLEPDVKKDLLKIIWTFGEPFADSSAVPTYYVSQAARQFVKVVLSGDGGDEAFAGYRRISASYSSQRFLGYFSPMFLATLGSITRSLKGVSKRRVQQAETLFRYQEMMRANRGWEHFYMFKPKLKKALYKDSFQNNLAGGPQEISYDSEVFAKTTGSHPVDRMMHRDYLSFMPDDYLTKVDGASMLNSLEVRSPFLDYRIVEYMARIPVSLKLKRGMPKYILKKIAENYMSHDLIYRAKAGFEIPVDSWLRNEWAASAQRFLVEDSPHIAMFFNMDVVAQLLEQHQSGRKNYKHQLWTLLVLELWLRLSMNGSVTPDSALD